MVLLTLILAAFLVTGLLFACAHVDETEEVTAIEMVKLPDKGYFLVGSGLDLSGAEINIYFITGQNRIYDAVSISDRLTVSGFDSSARQLNQTVTVTFGGQSTSFTVDIVNPEDIVDVVFNSDGGTEISPKKAIKDKPLSAYVSKPEPTKEGRIFNDWYVEGSSYSYDFTSVVVGDLSLVAKWDVTVTFIISGAGVENSVQRRFPEGSSVSQETLDSIYQASFPAKGGYDRVWYSDYATGAAIPEGYFDNLDDNKKVDCVYAPQLYYIYLQFNGATSVGGQGTDFPSWGVADFPSSENPDYPAEDGWRQVSADFGSTVNFGSAVKYTSVDNWTYDFIFDGWYRDAEYTDKWENNVSTVDRRNMTLYARFMWTVQFFSGTDQTGIFAPAVSESMRLDEGQKILYSDLPEIPEEVYADDGVTKQYYPKEGYTGWWSGVRLQYKEDSTSTVTENQSKLKDELSLEDILLATGIGTTNIFVNYYRIPFTVYFEDFIDGTDEKLTGLFYGDTLSYSRIPVKNDLSFDRWYLDKALSVAFSRDDHKAGGSAKSVEYKQLGRIYKAGDEGFDASMASGMSYGVMTLYAGYNANLQFFKNGGNPNIVNSSTAVAELAQNVLLTLREEATSLDADADPTEWWRDREGGYYRYAATASVPSIERWQGREGFWYYGFDGGEPNWDRTQPVDFDRITKNENLVVYYAIVRYDVTYVAETSDYVEGFPGKTYAGVLAEEVKKVTYQMTAPVRDTGYYLDILASSPVSGNTAFTDSEGINWIIEGWYTDTGFRIRFELSTAQVFNDTVLYAKWEREGTEGLSYELIDSGARRGTYAVSRGTVGEEKIIVIPAKYNGAEVSTVSGGAFKGMTSLEKFYVTDSVVYVESEAFRNSGLKAGNMPLFNAAVELETAVFDGTDWLADGKASGAEFIIFNRNTLYLYNGAGGDVVISDNITVIGASAFASSDGRRSVQSVTLHNGITAIRAEAFEGCSGIRSITSKDTEYFETSQLASIGDNAFYHLANLESIDIHGDNFATVDGVLYGMRNGEPVSLLVYPAKSGIDVFVMPETVSQIDDSSAFYSVENMRAFVFRRETAPTIPEYLFNKDVSGSFITFKALQYILLPDNQSYTDDNGDYSGVWQNVWNNASDNIRYNTINIRYNSPVEMNGVPENRVYAYGDSFREFEPSAAHLDFDGWFCFKDGEYLPYSEDMRIVWNIFDCEWENRRTTEVFDIYAEWSGEITFLLSDTASETFTVKAGEPLTGDALAVAEAGLYEKDGYMVRWKYTDGEEYLEKTEDGFKVLRGGEVFVTETQIVYEVSFKSHQIGENWVSYAETQFIPYGEQVALPPSPEPWDDELSFLVFGGWYTNEALTEPWVSGVSTVSGETTLYGRWLVPMTFIYDDYYTDEVEQYAQFGKNMNPPSVRMREGYSGEWVQRAEDGGSYTEVSGEGIFAEIREQRTYYAKYTINTYTVAFNVNGGSGAVASVTVQHGQAVAAPDYQGDKNGGMFAGWFTDIGGSSSYNFGTPVTSDMTLYAQFAEQLKGASFHFNILNAGAINFYSVTARPENLRQSVVLIPSVAYGANNPDEPLSNSAVIEIGANAFYGCDSVRHLIIPASISVISDSAFSNMPNLEIISVVAGNANYMAENGILYRIDDAGNKVQIVKVPAKVNVETLDVPETVTEIKPYAFENVKNITAVRLEAGHVRLGSSALNGISENNLRFFVPDRGVYLTDPDWSSYGNYVFSENVNIRYTDAFNGTDYSGDGYETSVRVLTALTRPTVTPENITYDGRTYTFGGWATDADGFNLYDFSETVTNDLRLYARWVLLGTTTGLQYRLTEIGGRRGYTVSKGTSTATDIVIANFYEGFPVLAVSPNGFMQSQAVSIYLPSTLVRVYDSSFIDIPNLERFTVDGRNKNFVVDNGALYSADFSQLILYPTALSEFTEFTVNANTESVWQYAFYKNRYLESVTVGQSVETIGYAAFSGSTTLISVTLNNQVPPEITADPFVNSRSDLKVFVPGTKSTDYTDKSVAAKYRDRYIDSEAHGKIYPLEARIFFIGDYDQSGSTLFIYQDVRVPGYAQALYEAPLRADAVFTGWFTQPYGGTEFIFTYETVNDDTVLYAHWKEATGDNDEQPPKPYLTYSVILGDELSVSVNREAVGFDALTEIVIASEYRVDGEAPRPVTTIADDGFANLPALKSVILPYSITRIGSGAFSGCSSLDTVSLPGTIQWIGDGAFRGCSKLREAELPLQITAIPNELFLDCTSLSRVKVWGNLTSVGSSAFKNCASLGSFDFGDALVSVGANAFEYCSTLAVASFPSTLKYIGGSAFRSCRTLNTLTFAEGSVVEEGIGEYAFADCERLVSVAIPKGPGVISDSLFLNCISLRTVSLGSSVSVIMNNAFRNCRSLSNIEFEGREGGILREVYNDVFNGCSSLTEFVFSGSFSWIGVSMLANCPSLERVVFLGGTVPSTYSPTFLDNSPNAKIYVPGTVSNIYVNLYKTRMSEYEDRIYPISADVVFDDGMGGQTRVTADTHGLLTPPETPEREGYVFGGWRILGTDGNWNFDADTVSENGMTLEARWVTAGTAGLEYVYANEIVTVYQGTLAKNVTDVVISNYYYYQNRWLPVSRIGGGLLTGTRAKTLYIPETVKEIVYSAFFNSIELAEINVAGDNENFTSVDGVLYNKAMNQLLRYPSAKPDTTFELRFSIDYIESGAFETLRNLRSFTSTNARFPVVDGALYASGVNGDGSYNRVPVELIAYPSMREETVMVIPATVTSIRTYALTLCENSPLAMFTVHEDNPVFEAYDNVLYQKVDEKRRILVRFPTAYDGNRFNVNVNTGADWYVTEIATSAFRYTTKLRAVTFSGATPVVLGANAFDGSETYILVPSDNVTTYRAADGWSAYAERIIPSQSTLTYDFNNGDQPVSYVVEALSSYPSLANMGLNEPTLAYSTGAGWFNSADGTRVEFDYDGSTGEETEGYSYFIYSDTTIYIKWEISELDATEGILFGVTEGGYTVQSGTSVQLDEKGVIIVPSYHLGLPVVSVSDNAFVGMKELRRVVLPETVKSIGSNAFGGCEKLTNLTILATEPPTVSQQDIETLRKLVSDKKNGNFYTYVRSDCRTRYGGGSYGMATMHIKDVEANVRFMSEDGTTLLATQKVLNGVEAATPIEAPTIAGKRFIGWYEGGNPYGFGVVMPEATSGVKTVTLVARYEDAQ